MRKILFLFSIERLISKKWDLDQDIAIIKTITHIFPKEVTDEAYYNFGDSISAGINFMPTSTNRRTNTFGRISNFG